MAKEYMTSRATALLPLPLRCLSPFGAGEESRGHERHLKFGYWSFLGIWVWDLELPPGRFIQRAGVWGTFWDF